MLKIWKIECPELGGCPEIGKIQYIIVLILKYIILKVSRSNNNKLSLKLCVGACL